MESGAGGWGSRSCLSGFECDDLGNDRKWTFERGDRFEDKAVWSLPVAFCGNDGRPK